jgi:hypothetical protein
MKGIVALVFIAVAGCGGGSTATTGPTQVPPLPAIPSTDLAGRVVNLFGQAVAGARVTIGAGSVVTTDAQGKFTVSNAAPAYDAAVAVEEPIAALNGPPSIGRAVVYRGLTRRDPVFYIPEMKVVQGSVVHSNSPPQTILSTGSSGGGQILLWAFTNALGFVATGDFTGAPKFFIWFGPSDAVNVGSLALLFASSGGITASGSAPFTAGEATSSITVPLTTTTPLTVSGTARPAAGCLIGVQEVVVPSSDGRTASVLASAGPRQPDGSVPFTIPVGFTNDLPLSLRIPVGCAILGTSVVARRLSPSTTNLDVNVPAPPQITAPAPFGTATSATSLTWTAPSGAVSVLHFDRIDTNGALLGTLDVATASTSTTFPDLTALGAVVLPGSTLNWRVESWGGVNGTDGLAATTGSGALLAGTGNFSHGVSESSTIVTQR